MLKTPELFEEGFRLENLTLPPEAKIYVEQERWKELDQLFLSLTKRDGDLFRYLNTYHDFENIEFIISIRDSQNEWEEDGIWHDDGSRVFAFSLSLTLSPETIVGGKLGIRRIGSEQMKEIPTPKFGEIILFLTGVHGYEHKIHQVIEGKRIIIAGWCS